MFDLTPKEEHRLLSALFCAAAVIATPDLPNDDRVVWAESQADCFIKYFNTKK